MSASSSGVSVSGDPGSVPPFSRQRAWGGFALLLLVIVLALIDAFSPDFQLDYLVLGLILGTALLLLGVEAGRKLLG